MSDSGATKRKGKSAKAAPTAEPAAAAKPIVDDTPPARSASDSAGGSDRRDRDCAPAPAMRMVGLTAVLLTAVLLGALYFVFSIIHSSDDDYTSNGVESPMYPPDLPHVAVLGAVSRVRLPGDDMDFATGFANLGQPIILSNTPADKWPVHKWTPKQIAGVLPRLPNVQRHRNRTFYYYHADHPLSQIPSIAAERKAMSFDRVESIPTLEFFQTISRGVNVSAGEPYLYYASKVENFGDLYFDMKPIDRLMVRELGARNWERIETNVWIGPENATTHAHYDIQHSFYVQIRGSKRFLLWGPEQIDNMYLYPHLHPAHQSSQVDMESPNYELFPRFRRCRAMEAILMPGDVLYLPPLWMHHVTALTPSMSISVWTSHSDNDAMDALESAGVPFPQSWKIQHRIPGGLHLLRAILDSPKLESVVTVGAAAFARELIASRYFRLFRDHPTLANTGFPEACGLPVSRTLLDETSELVAEWKEFIANAITAFNDIRKVERRVVWMRNYVEMVAHVSAGVERAGAFLRCLANEPKAAM